MLGLSGVTAIESKAAGVTVSVVEPETAPRVAPIEDDPVATAVARPPAVMVAAAGVADTQVTWPVRSSVVLSVSVPVAVNCCASPFGTLGLSGVTAIDCKAAGVTVSAVEPETVPIVALSSEERRVGKRASPGGSRVGTHDEAE